MSLRTRLILSYTLIIVLCLSIVASSLMLVLQNNRDRLAMTRLNDMAAPIYVQVRALARGQTSLNQVWSNLEEQAQETGTYIFLLDTYGNIIMEASPGGVARGHSFDLLSVELPPDMSEPYPGKYVTAEGTRFIFIAYPLGGLFRFRSTVVPSALVLAIPRSYALAIWGDLAKPFLWSGFIALCVSIIIAFFLARSVYIPIRQITCAAEEIARGRYDYELPVEGPKEVKGLALSFNQMTNQVRHSQQMLRNFVADVSHEMRSPLTSIRGFAQAMIDGTARDSESQAKAARIIEDESKRMMRLVDELLELSKIESGQIKMVKEPVDLGELMRHCQEIFSRQAEENGLQLVVNIESLPPVVGDIDRLEQVFNNLLDNAMKHTSAEGVVSVSACQLSAGLVEVTVADTGTGIPPEQLSYVFERFYRADASAKTSTGLGLAIAREIVRAHGGDIRVNSAVGKGTEFLVRLPASPAISSEEVTS